MQVKDFLHSLLHGHSCPYFRDPPVADADLDFILQTWTLCDYEDRCLEVDTCPMIKGQYPKLKDSK